MSACKNINRPIQYNESASPIHFMISLLVVKNVSDFCQVSHTNKFSRLESKLKIKIRCMRNLMSEDAMANKIHVNEHESCFEDMNRALQAQIIFYEDKARTTCSLNSHAHWSDMNGQEIFPSSTSCILNI